MTTGYARHVSKKGPTPQTEPIPGSNQVANSAGGYSYAVDDWARLERFLILGSEGGTYYVSEKKLTQENAKSVLACLKADPGRTIDIIVAVSDAGRAPKNDPAIFALALCAAHGSPEAKQLAYAAVPKVCRIGTHLFQFAADSDALRGWGRGLRNAIAAWYKDRDAESLARQVVKYQQRNGWSHRDLLRLSHPKVPQDSDTNAVLHWAVKGWEGVGEEPHPNRALLPIWAMERAKVATTEQEVARLIRDYKLPRECIPTQWLNSLKVWEALAEDMPITALVRNLGKMTAIGLVKPLSDVANKVVADLTDAERLKKGRVHPLGLLVALKTYAQGHGDKGSLKWTPVQSVVQALDEAFYLSFGAIRPTNKRWFLGLDVSGSMSSQIAGMPLSCCEAATALSLVATNVEKNTFSGAFNNGLTPLPFTKKTRLDDALRHTRSVNFGGTDCSLPMTYALERKLNVDAFVVLTDSETYAGNGHACQRLKEYRQKTGIGAKLIVVAMTSNGFTIADPNDGGMLDVVGFDTATPAVMSEFVGYKE